MKYLEHAVTLMKANGGQTWPLGLLVMTTTSNSHWCGSTANCHRMPRRTMKRGGWWSQNDQHYQVKDDQRPNREKWEVTMFEDLQIMRQAHCAALSSGCNP